MSDPRDELVFVLPEPGTQMSGGHLYNGRLIRALRTLVPVTAVSLEQGRSRFERGAPGLYFVDTLFLSELPRFTDSRPGQRLLLLVHHLPSLEPGTKAGDAALAEERAALARCHGFVVTSPYSARVLCERGRAPADIVTVLPAPPAGRVERKRYQPPLRALLVNNLIPRKAVLEFLQRLESFTKPEQRFIVDIAGGGDIDAGYAARCHALVRESPSLGARVRLLGTVPNDAIGAHYRRADVFVSASRMETFGMALQEARAFGLPILALDAGHAGRHFSHEENGLLFLSIEELVAGLLELAEDAAATGALCKRAWELRSKEEYTWGAAAERFLRGVKKFEHSGEPAIAPRRAP